MDGYCVQKTNTSPTRESKFTLIEESDEKLVKVAKYLNQKGFNNDVKQTALWSVSDGGSVSGIYQDGNESVEKLREYVCSLTGQENVWYNTNPTYSVDENRNIIQETTKVEGVLSYNVTKTGNMKMEICKENGEVLSSLGAGTPIANSGEYRFNFSVKVKGWESGKYSVQLKIDDQVIHKKYFSIG